MKTMLGGLGSLTSLSLPGDTAAESFIKKDADLEKLTKEFESLLVSQMMKSMRAGIESGGIVKKGFGEDVFTGMLDDEYAKSVPDNNSNSLWQTLYRQLSNKKSK